MKPVVRVFGCVAVVVGTANAASHSHGLPVDASFLIGAVICLYALTRPEVKK